MVDIIDLAKDFQVSTDAIFWRLVNLKVLKRETVENLIKDPKRKELDRTMRQSLYAKMDVGKYPERYISLCCRSLIEGKISRGVFARYLDIDRVDIDSFLNKFGFQENNYEEIAAA